ncbi:MAG: class I SAM-dependent methyltransferase [Pirellulales bacterium]|nr:class I SAM-dependent methyltransferase [Pirellulales bacterium]
MLAEPHADALAQDGQAATGTEHASRTTWWKPLYLFEFMDLPWLPQGLRHTLREILECVSTPPFRTYYRWVARETLQQARRVGVTQVVELGAGTARITATMAAMASRGEDAPNGLGTGSMVFVCCDNNPDVPAYEALARRFGPHVRPIYEPIDLAEPRQWGPDSLLVLSATLHHIPHSARSEVLRNLCHSGNGVLVFEPLRRTIWSMLYVLLSIVPALVVPLRFAGRAGRLRRVLWCWLLPVAPLLFCWDGIVSCLRQWTRIEWDRAAAEAGCRCKLGESLFCQCAYLRRAS